MDASDGGRMFRHACALGLEGIVSKRVASRYNLGSCIAWVKVKNPADERRATPSSSRFSNHRSRLTNKFLRSSGWNEIANVCAFGADISRSFRPGVPFGVPERSGRVRNGPHLS